MGTLRERLASMPPVERLDEHRRYLSRSRRRFEPTAHFKRCACGRKIRVEYARCARCNGVKKKPKGGNDALDHRATGSFENGDSKMRRRRVVGKRRA